MRSKFTAPEKESILMVIQARKAGGESHRSACWELGIAQGTTYGWLTDLASPGLRASEAAHVRRYGRGEWTHKTRPNAKRA